MMIVLIVRSTLVSSMSLLLGFARVPLRLGPSSSLLIVIILLGRRLILIGLLDRFVFIVRYVLVLLLMVLILVTKLVLVLLVWRRSLRLLLVRLRRRSWVSWLVMDVVLLWKSLLGLLFLALAMLMVIFVPRVVVRVLRRQRVRFVLPRVGLVRIRLRRTLWSRLMRRKGMKLLRGVVKRVIVLRLLFIRLTLPSMRRLVVPFVGRFVPIRKMVVLRLLRIGLHKPWRNHTVRDNTCNPRTTVYTDYGKLISLDCTSESIKSADEWMTED